MNMLSIQKISPNEKFWINFGEMINVRITKEHLSKFRKKVKYAVKNNSNLDKFIITLINNNIINIKLLDSDDNIIKNYNMKFEIDYFNIFDREEIGLFQHFGLLHFQKYI